MRKRIRAMALCLFVIALFCGSVWARDFTTMTNRELADLRGTIENVPQAEQDAFNKEWTKRLAAMTDQEKKLYDKPLAAAPEAGEKPKLPYAILGQGYDDSQGKEIDIYSTGDVTAPRKEEPGK